MKLGEKLRHLRKARRSERGRKRAMTQYEMACAVRAEMSYAISQSYISQLENGRKVRLTDNIRILLAKFFRVHPGYLTDDPAHHDLPMTAAGAEQEFILWLINGAERFHQDPAVADALLKLAQSQSPRGSVIEVSAALGDADLDAHMIKSPSRHARQDMYMVSSAGKMDERLLS